MYVLKAAFLGARSIFFVRILQKIVFISKHVIKIILSGILNILDVLFDIHSVRKVSGIDHSKSPFKEIVKNPFDAKLAPLSSILTWSSSAICHLVCSQCSMLSVYLKCVSRLFQWIRILNKEFVSNFGLQMEFRVRNR